MNKKEKALQNLETLANFHGMKTDDLFIGVLRDIVDALPDEPRPKLPFVMLTEVPKEIMECALKLGDYMALNNHKEWALGNVQNRVFPK